MRVRGRWIPLVLVALVVSGCSGNDENSTPGTAAAPPAADMARKAPGEPVGGPEADGTDQQAKAPDLTVRQRSIVYTGSISVRMKDGQKVDAAAARAAAIAAGAGGFVSSDKRTSGTGHAEATLELRVPADRFAVVVEQLAGLGTEQQRGIDTEDVTEQTIDLDARIKSQQARVDSGRTLLAQAKNLSDLVMLERELAGREADLASLQAKQRRLADLTALSTITAVLLDQTAVVPATDDGGFLGGLASGWNALLASLKVLLTVLGALLPWAVTLGLPVVAVLWLLRRRASRAPTTSAAPTPASPTDPAHPTVPA